MNTCPDLAMPPPDAVAGSGHATPVQGPAGARDALQACVTKLSGTYHGVVTYQPANRYWPFQWIETGAFLALAALLTWLCFYWIRHRTT
jgi:hypothetical protein